MIKLFKKIKLICNYYEYIFYSENINYFNSYKNFILKLAEQKKNSKILHLVSDDEKNYENLIIKKNIITINIGFGSLRTLIFPLIRGKYFFMTLTNLGNFYLKKSIKCLNYVYFFHSLASIERVYEYDAFKNYDIICCNGPYQKIKLIDQEKKNNFKKKKLYETGFLYLDFLTQNIKNDKREKKTILFAPSWNENKINLFDTYGLDIVKNLINNNFKVILRPHPEHYIRSKKNLKNILDKFINDPNFSLSKNLLDLDSLEKSSLLITDFSGISIEFIAILKRPVILLEIGEKIFNKNWNNQEKLFEDKFKDQFAIKQKSEEELIKKLLFNVEKYVDTDLDKKSILQTINNNLYNYGNVEDNILKFFK